MLKIDAFKGTDVIRFSEEMVNFKVIVPKIRGDKRRYVIFIVGYLL